MNTTYQVAGNELVLLQNGTDFFPLMCADIDAAKHSVYLETYILADDESGRMVSKALQRAASRNVAVQVLLDGFGSAEFPQSCVDEFEKAGVDLQWFRREISPFTMRRSRMRRLRRMHRKMVAIDGEIAYIGGINFINDIPANQEIHAPRLDYAVRVQGRVAYEIQEAMRHLWATVKWATLRKRIGRLQARIRGMQTKVSVTEIELVLRDNLRHRRDIERAYLEAIGNAKREIIIANAYFLPRRAFRQALKDAAKRGVQVVLLLQGKVEYFIQHYATLALYGQLLDSGIEIYEYRDSYLHAKVGVVDGVWATVGSSNLEPFSLLLALEANLVVRDEEFAGALRSSLWHAIKSGGERVENFNNFSWRQFDLLLARISYGLIRLVVGFLGISKKH
jgi:cardiolipin synthase